MKRDLMLSPALPVVLHRMTSAREAFRLRRAAHTQGLLWQFCLEHELRDEARRARSAVLDNLAEACSQWRLLLGLSTRGRGA